MGKECMGEQEHMSRSYGHKEQSELKPPILGKEEGYSECTLYSHRKTEE
jgi:hypothetical protein